MTHGLIINVDGTLVDSNGARAQAWLEALREHGHIVGYETLRKLIGRVAGDILIETTGLGRASTAGASIHARYLDIFERRLLKRLVPFCDAPELVDRLIRSGLRVSVTSHDPPGILLPLLRIAGAERLFHRSGTPDGGVADTGSNRDLIKAALDRVGASPPHVLLLTDNPFDIEAAGLLNVPVIAVRSGGWSRRDLGGAIAIYDDVTELRAKITTSPIAGLLRRIQADAQV